MEKIKISLITVCFNSEETISRTIESVLAQSDLLYEYVIVDGASTDRTIEKVKSYQNLFNGKLKLVSEKDRGIYDAMNKGIRLVSGDLIGIVNSDDWLESSALEGVIEAYIAKGRNNNVLYCGGINFVSENETKVMKVNLKSFIRQVPLYIMSGIRHPGVFVPKKVYEKVGLFNSNLKLSADQDFILRCYFKDVEFYDMNFVVSNMAKGGISTSYNKKSWNIAVNDRKTMLKSFHIKGLKYFWLMWSWRIRNSLTFFLKRILSIF